MTLGNIHFGAAYYPEHWTKEEWAADIRLMKAAGFTVVRMGEFAWSRFEPQEGKFDFAWMEEAIAMLAEAGIQTVMGTPTAAPPSWMMQQYPEVLRTGSDGRKVQFGNRLHYCVESPQYHEFTRKLAEAMAKQFGSNPHVIGWQIDNEFGAECHCELCRSAFQEYLKEKFGSLEVLNARWTTHYWSQAYTDWGQIELPRGGHNPGLLMAYRQYFGDAYRRYQKLQIDALRKYIPEDVWITHNFHGSFNRFDHFDMAQDLDLASYDYYVGSGHNDPALSAFKWDLARGLKQQNFWVMETQPGGVNWSTLNTKLNQGETRAMNWQAIGHGADAILYWQWRSALNGQEQYHGTLVDQAGQPRPFYSEAAELGDDLMRVREVLENTTLMQNRVAILFDFESRWSLENQPHHERFDYWEGLLKYYRVFHEQSIGVDIVSPDADLTHYNLVVVPYMVVIDDGRADNLIQYANGGGHIIMTCRTAVKDRYDAMLPQRPPGLGLQDIAGVEVEEYYPLDHAASLESKKLQDTGTARIWAEKLKMAEFKIITPLAKYRPFNGWLDGAPAITTNMLGRGIVWYVGCILDDTAHRRFVKYVIDYLLIILPLKEVPFGMEACARENEAGEKFYILINHQNQSIQTKFPQGFFEYITRAEYPDEINVPPYAVAVLGKRKEPEIPAEEPPVEDAAATESPSEQAD